MKHITYSVLDSRPGRSSHTVPSNERLLTAEIACSNELMVDREVTDVSNLGAGALQIRRRVLLVVTVGGDGNTSDRRGCRLSREPDNDILPIVTVAETRGGRVLGHVPAVHDAELAAVGAGTSIHLTGGGRASTVRSSGGIKTATSVIVRLGLRRCAEL